MDNEFWLIEKIELITTPLVDRNNLRIISRSFSLLEGEDPFVIELKSRYGDKWEKYRSLLSAHWKEIEINPEGHARIKDEQVVEESDAQEKHLLPVLRSLLKAYQRLSFQEYIIFEKKQSDKKCVELNALVLQDIYTEYQKLQKLAREIQNSPEQKNSLSYLLNVLYRFAEWFEAAQLKIPDEIDKIIRGPATTRQQKEADRIEFERICIRMKLVPGVKVENEVLFDIGMEMFPQRMPDWKDFKNHKMMKYLRYLASRTKYAVKRGPPSTDSGNDK